MLEFAFTALLLGLKHSFDADHLLAVSNIMTEPGSLRNALRLSLSWCAGHMIGAVAVTLALFVFRDSYLPFILGNFEAVVALTLIVFGILGVYQALAMRTHRHGGRAHASTHLGDKGRSHGHIFGIGVLQGLASNDELLLLMTFGLGLGSIIELLGGVFIFSAGVVAGMLAFAILADFAFVRSRSIDLGRAVNLAVGAASFIWGAWMLA